MPGVRTGKTVTRGFLVRDAGIEQAASGRRRCGSGRILVALGGSLSRCWQTGDAGAQSGPLFITIASLVGNAGPRLRPRDPQSCDRGAAEASALFLDL